jgi:hypothetical protein
MGNPNIYPYRVGSWVVGVEFYGRDHLLQDILSGLANALWIIGNRRVGKTSLLRAVEHQAANSDQYLPLFWDMQGDTNEAELIESLLEAIENAQWSGLDERWKDIDLPESNSSINQILRRVAAHSRQHRCRLLLLCDEIEGLNQLGQQEPHVLCQLRRAMQQTPAVRTVLASTRRLSRLYAIQQQQDTSLFLEGFEPRYLAHFNDNTANQIICRMQSEHPLVVDETLLAKIRSFSGNHPLILQKVCSQLFDPNTNALCPFVENEFDLVDDQLSGTFQQDFDSLTLDEARVLLLVNSKIVSPKEIRQAFPNLSENGLRRILYDLTQLGFLRQIEGNYQAGSIPLGQWLAAGPSHHDPQGGVTNRMMHEVAQERVTALQRQLIACIRHLGHLELRQAKQGLDTPPYIITEIEDYKKKVANIEAELAELGENIALSPQPQIE